MFFHGAFCIFALSAVCSGVIIHAGPKNTTAVVGEMVTFQCHYSDSFDVPRWRINGIASSSLPEFHSVTSNGLEISSVQLEMNNWVYVCFFTTIVNGQQETVESLPAHLTVNVALLLTSVTTVYNMMTSNVYHISSAKLLTTASMAKTNPMSTISRPTETPPTPKNISSAVLLISNSLPVPTVLPHTLSWNSLYIGVGIGTSAVILICSVIIFFVLLRCKQYKAKTTRVTVEEHDPEYEEVPATTAVTAQVEPEYAEVLEMFQLKENMAYAAPKLCLHTTNEMHSAS